MNTELKIKLFKFDEMRCNSSNVLIVGPDEEKRTQIVQTILDHKREQLKKVVVFSDNEKYTKPQLCIVNDYNPSNGAVSEKNVIEYNFVLTGEFDEKLVDEKDCAILDISENCDIPSGFFNNADASLRIACLERYKGLDPQQRIKIDYIFLLADTEDRRTLWIECCGIIPKFKVFSKLLDLCTTNDEFFAIDNYGTSKEIEEHIYWGKCEEPQLNDDEFSSSESFSEGLEELEEMPENAQNAQNVTYRRKDDCIIL